MTGSARGTREEPGRNIRQKAGLNRAILDVSPSQIRVMLAYKTIWNGGAMQAVPAPQMWRRMPLSAHGDVRADTRGPYGVLKLFRCVRLRIRIG